jgi:hypothetical protein
LVLMQKQPMVTCFFAQSKTSVVSWLREQMPMQCASAIFFFSLSSDRGPCSAQCSVTGGLQGVHGILVHAFQSKLDMTAFEFFSDKALFKVMGRGDVSAPFDTACSFYASSTSDSTIPSLGATCPGHALRHVVRPKT